jgi:hypothetical protein
MARYTSRINIVVFFLFKFKLYRIPFLVFFCVIVVDRNDDDHGFGIEHERIAAVAAVTDLEKYILRLPDHSVITNILLEENLTM